MTGEEAGEDATLLQEIHHNKLMEFLPVIVSLILLTILGIVGNSFTIRFYSALRRKSSTSIFIQYLGVVDLFVCILSFASIANLAVNLYFTAGILCKLLYFFCHWGILSSVLILWIISIDRYLKVCRPLGRQFSKRWAVLIIVVVLIFSVATSISEFLVYDSVPVEINIYIQNYSRALEIAEANNGTNNNNDIISWNAVPVVVHGHYCTSTENIEVQFVVKISTFLDAVVIITVLVTFVATYGNISRTLLKSSKRQTCCIDKNKQDPRTESYVITCSSPNLKKARALSQSMPDILAPSNKSIKSNSRVVTHSLSRNKSSRETDRITWINMNKRKRKVTDANVTAMMAIVSLAFVLSFIPFFIITGIRVVSTTTENELSALHQLALRSPFLNSIINPIIFCIFNPRYRRFLTKRFTVAEETDTFTSLKHQGQTRNRFESSSRL